MGAHKIKAAIVGIAGRIASQLEKDPLRVKPATHLGAYKLHPAIEDIYGCDLPKKLPILKGEFGHLPLYSSLEIMMDKHHPEIVSVCTPDETHHDIVVRLAEQWKPKVIWCEKPLSTDSESAQSMVDACKSYKVSLTVNYSRRWCPIYGMVKCQIERDNVLEIVGVTNGERGGKPQTHLLDLFNWYRQPETKLHYIQLPHDNYLIFELHIYTDKKTISILYNGRRITLGFVARSRHYSGLKEARTISSKIPLFFSETNTWAVQNIVNHIQNGEQLSCTGEDGVKALQLMEKLKLA